MRIKFMRQIIRKLKTIYYFIFTQLAYRLLETAQWYSLKRIKKHQSGLHFWPQ
jgi:hypothetical protein